MLIRAMFRNSIGLGLFAVFTAGLIALSYALTRERAADNAAAYAARILYELVPEQLYDQPLEQQTVTISSEQADTLGYDRPQTAFQAIREQQVTAVVLPVRSTNGYSGNIDLLAAIDETGTLLAARVVAHQETPGLGDGIEADRSNWILQFDNQSLQMPAPENWAVQRDGGHFDQLTGATITSRAVVDALRRSLAFFADYRNLLLQPADRSRTGVSTDD